MTDPQAGRPAVRNGASRRFAPRAPGWESFWLAAADTLAPWLAERAGVSVAIVVPRAALIAPLRRALRTRMAPPGRPWAPPRIRAPGAWADELAPAVPVDPLERMLSMLDVLDEAMPDSLPHRAPADRLAFAQGLVEVLDAFAQAGAAGRLDDPAVVARVVREFGTPAAEARLREDVALLARVADAVGAAGMDPVALGVERMHRVADGWAAGGTHVAWIGWQSPEPLEAVLLARLDEVLDPDALLRLEPDWRALAATMPVVAAAWPELVPDSPARPLRDRLRAWRAAPPGTVPRILHAADREREAQLAAQWVHGRLARSAADGSTMPRLAIVALDRWLARRVRALLERAGVLIDDREGWLLSTTVAATAAMGWLDAVAGDGYYDDLLGWLDSRFVRPPADRALRGWIERAATRHGYLRNWHGLCTAGADGEPPGPMLRLRELAERQSRAQPLRTHLDVLEQAMRWAGVPRRLAADTAGRQLLGLLESLRRTAAGAGHGRPMSLAGFRATLAMVLERHRFYGPIESPVELLTPIDAAGREFDAVIVLGASEASLPAPPPPLPLVNEPLREMLGLPTAAGAAVRQQRDVALLVTLAAEAAFTCRTDPSDGTRPSPWVERVEAIVADLPLGHRIDPPGAPRAVAPCRASRPGLPLGRMPAKVAVGALERLVACPFRFVAQDGWRLREAPEAVDVPGVRERGELVHEVLERFHREASRRGLVPDAATRAEARALLVEVTDEIGARELASGGGSLGELAEWRATLDDYLAWAVSDAADGWRWLDGERPGAAVVAFATGEEAAGTLRIEGRLDRLDVGPDGTLRVVDYKLGAPARLKRITDAPERAAQLAMYAWIASDAGEVGASGYLSLRRGEVTWMPLSLPASDVLRAWRERLPEVLGRIAGGEAMHASGSECGHCASRGLCRKGHWS